MSRIIYCDVNLLRVLLLIPISVWMHDWNEILQMWSLADIIHSCEFNFFRPPNWSACFFLPSRLRSPNLKIHHVYSANLQENWQWVLKFLHLTTALLSNLALQRNKIVGYKIRIDKLHSLLGTSPPKLFAFVKNKLFIQFAFLNFFTIFFDCPNNHFPQIYHSKLHRVFW